MGAGSATAPLDLACGSENGTWGQYYKEKHKLDSKKSETHHAKQYEVTSFLSTDCELSTETCSKNVYSLGPGLSNHSPEPNHVCAHITLRRICNTDGNVIAKLSLRILFLYRVLYVFKGLAPTCAAVSLPAVHDLSDTDCSYGKDICMQRQVM